MSGVESIKQQIQNITEENNLIDQKNSSLDEEKNAEKQKKMKYSDEVLDLDCEWEECDFNTNSLSVFMNHAREHIRHAEVRTYSPPPDNLYVLSQQDVFVCLWKDCEFECPSSHEMVRHINYHSFHTKLMCLGLNMIKSQNLTGCGLDSTQRNVFQDLTEPFKCKWKNCDKSNMDFDHPQIFFWHVESHAYEDTDSCQWVDCTKKDFASKTRVREHLRSHSKEKLLGCPTCGASFASRIKLVDHLKRQQGNQGGFTCTNCNKSFALERLLRDHMRSHINHYECAECGMCWPTPSSLQNHIKYRHSQRRDFPCDQCEHKAKSPADLKQHTRTHQGEVLTCLDGCGFVCKSNNVMKNHILKKHMKSGPAFECHLCNRLYRRGSYLTTHLKKKHEVEPPPYRFRYTRDESTGLNRAQLVRFEMQQEGIDEKEDGEVEERDEEAVYSVHDADLETVYSIQGAEAGEPLSSVRTSSPILFHSSSSVHSSTHYPSSPNHVQLFSSPRIPDGFPTSPVLGALPSSPYIQGIVLYPASSDTEMSSYSSGTISLRPFKFLRGESGEVDKVEIDITGEQFGSGQRPPPPAQGFNRRPPSADPLEEDLSETGQSLQSQKLSELKSIVSQGEILHFTVMGSLLSHPTQ